MTTLNVQKVGAIEIYTLSMAHMTLSSKFEVLSVGICNQIQKKYLNIMFDMYLHNIYSSDFLNVTNLIV